MTVITLLTDFGMRDGYPGAMKGVIWKIAPGVQITDLSHEISPQNILEAALLLSRTAPYFPDGTIHVAVVDPGVGTSRRGIAAQIGSQYFIGPDNGLFSFVIARAEAKTELIQYVYLNRPEYWLPNVSPVFHGRDIFAPIAAHLASGIPLDNLGTEIIDPIRLALPIPKRTQKGWLGQVIHIDHFGNLSTNFDLRHLQNGSSVIVKVKDRQIFGLASTFGEQPLGTLIVLIDSSGSLAISVVNGSAADELDAQLGDQVEVTFNE
jgi:S-adenosyl-L-methionine hydrolase (adenosine-forming)